MHTACSLSQIPDRSSTQMFTIDCCMWPADRWCVLVESAASVRPVIDWAPAADDVSCCSLYCGGWLEFFTRPFDRDAAKPDHQQSTDTASPANCDTARDLVHSRHENTAVISSLWGKRRALIEPRQRLWSPNTTWCDKTAGVFLRRRI